LVCFVLFASRQPPRACTDYWSEWKLCRSIRNLYHHYYTYGEMPSCAQWKKDYKNCKEWERTQSTVAKVQYGIRRGIRKMGSYRNIFF
uniref:Synaptic plasticity regulator PANTS n=1 Tax=Pseudonaja textilis TaxID=8673 RepID=A0A670ZRF9_PSETE